MTFKELEKWDKMLSCLSARELESVIMLAVSELQMRAEVAENENENV